MRLARLACLCLPACLMLSAPAAAGDARDRSFEPGRVGAIVIGATAPADLDRLYGAASVRRATMDEPGGGESHPGALVHQGTDDALEVHFSDDGKRIVYVNVLGRSWRGPNGLRVGLTAGELERLNGAPYKFYGFGFDYGGQVLATGPALAPFTIFIHPVDAGNPAMKELTKPEVELPSTLPAVKAADLRVSFIRVDAPRKD